METGLRTQVKPGPALSATPMKGTVLQRKCDCGQHTIAGGECDSCAKNQLTLQRAVRTSELGTRNSVVPPIVHDVLRSSGQPLDAATHAFMEPRFGHDFSRVQTLSDVRVAHSFPAQLLSTNGARAISSLGVNEAFINGPGKGPSQSSATPAPRPQPSAVKTASDCPTEIRIVEVGQGNDTDFGKKGPITGWGGFARMEVSDPSGKTWDGTAIHENLRRTSNTCGDWGEKACANSGADDRTGRATGSSFKVGAESDFLGLAELPAVRNRFWDLHTFVDKTTSFLLNQPTCEIQCEQFYDCGGRRFGSDFVITYAMTRGAVVRSGGGYNAVTRVKVRKAAKTTPAASPATPSGVVKP